MTTKKSPSPLQRALKRASHDVRTPLDGATYPVLCRLRGGANLPVLRTPHVFAAIRDATETAAALGKIRICHLSIQRDRLLLLVEAHDEEDLARGMQGFSIAAARGINAAITKATKRTRRGPVWADRYHARVLHTPAEVRDALAHVYNSWRRTDRPPSRKLADQIDPLSSAHYFTGWAERAIELAPPAWPPLWIMLPRTRLLWAEWATDPRGALAFDELPDVPELLPAGTG